MSYLVMECHPGYAVLLDEEGRFLKAANLRYETGQTVYDPVLMKETRKDSGIPSGGSAAASRRLQPVSFCSLASAITRTISSPIRPYI